MTFDFTTATEKNSSMNLDHLGRPPRGFGGLFCVVVLSSAVCLLHAEEPKKAKDDGVADLLTKDTMDAFGEYASRLEGLIKKSGSQRELEVHVTIVPDAYRYTMAKECKEFGAAGYEGKELWREIVKAHNKHAQLSKKLFASFTIKARGDAYFFVEQGKKFLHLKGRSSKSFSLLRTSDKLVCERWQVFVNCKGKRAIFKKTLGRIDTLKIEATTGSIKLDKKEPFTWRLKNVIRQAKSDGLNAVNAAQRQIGCTKWADLFLPEVAMKFYPGSWEIPDPPDGFDRLLKKLAKTR